MICDIGDVVIVPFPFIDKPESKIRPVMILSSESFNGSHGISHALMITSANATSWETDIKISDLKKCGLKKNCVIRFKIFSIDNHVIKRYLGKIPEKDLRNLKERSKMIWNICS